MAFVDMTNNSSLSPTRADVCANCNVSAGATLGAGDGAVVKLKNCMACCLVKYCGVDCQRAHRKQHKKACKKRAAELKDEQLYRQGHERPEGDFCLICTLPIPLPIDRHSGFNACCMKRVCHGCHLAAQKRGMFDCPFCRTPTPDNDADELAMVQARVEKKDPVAILVLGKKYYFGELGLQKDMRRAVELYTKAAELGSVEALFDLGNACYNGEGVERDKVKAAEFYEKAAMQGHARTRHALGCIEVNRGNHDRAARHFLISAKMGLRESVQIIKKDFIAGHATKAQYAEALRGYQDAVEETNSPQREEAKLIWNVAH